jgi:hypothetical protein
MHIENTLRHEHNQMKDILIAGRYDQNDSERVKNYFTDCNCSVLVHMIGVEDKCLRVYSCIHELWNEQSLKRALNIAKYTRLTQQSFICVSNNTNFGS